jgi:hypothetical protein
MQPAANAWPDRPVFDGIFGATANPLRLIFMIGAVWRLSREPAADKVQILEIGSWCGASALAWGEGIERYFGGNGKITCVDAWQPYVDLDTNQGGADRDMDAALRDGEPFEIFRHNIGFLPDSVAVDIRKGWSRDVLPKLPAGLYDLVYIDGDHTYAGVLSDIEQAAPLVRTGGILCGDDLELEAGQCDLGVLQARPNMDKHVDPARGVQYHPGVAKAVGEFFGPVSSWSGFWAMQKTTEGWAKIPLNGMPPHIPRHLHPKSLMGLKALLMAEGLL